MTDQQHRALAKILWTQVKHNRKIKAIEKQGLDLSPLKIDIFFDVLDFLGYPDGADSDLALKKFFEACGHHSRMEGYLKWAEQHIARRSAPYN